MAARSRAAAAGVKEIGPLPPVADPARRKACERDLRRFALTYFAPRFPLPFIPDHDTVIAALQAVTIDGGQAAYAMPRGSGKTTLVEVAIVFALGYGYRAFVVPIGATAAHADGIVAAVKAEVEANPLLLADFPEMCHPVRALEGVNQRAKAQTLGGRLTRLDWSAGALRLADIPGSPSAGAIVEGRGLEGSIRGMKRTGAGGRQVRPDMVILDDPQTDESARMPGQSATRERTINGAVLGLAGPGRAIAAVMPCTVIAPNDLSDRILDREKNPQWNGVRTKALYSFPEDTDWWDRYAETRRESFRRFGDNRLGTALYEQDRERADRGARAAWPQRFDPVKCRSAIQELMDFKIDRPEAFQAEAQNDPMSLNPEADALALDPAEVAVRLNGVPRGVVPRECSRLTAFVDLSESVLWWLVAGWDERFGGAVVDYGTYPKQARTYFRQADARPALRDVHPGMPIEAALFAGLKALGAEVLGREWPTEAGQVLKVERTLVDAGDLPDVVYQFARASPLPVYPSKGFGITASGRPVREWPKKPGEVVGRDWLLGVPESGRGRLVKVDANEWKTFVAERLRNPLGAPAGLWLFGKEGEAHVHQLLADHCGAEYPVVTSGRGRTLREWKDRPGQDNHLWDCLVGAAVAASVAGVKWSPAAAAGEPEAPRPARKRRDIGDLYAAAEGAGR